MKPGTVVGVSRKKAHGVNKQQRPEIRLLEQLGVEGDAHMGTTVQHRSRVAANPDQPNLRQVHLVHAELLAELAQAGYSLQSGEMGENVTTRGVDLLSLPRGTVVELGHEARVELTGLRNPCDQLDGIQPGLMERVLGRTADGELVRKAGVMGIVLESGIVRPGDSIRIVLPALPHHALEPV